MVKIQLKRVGITSKKQMYQLKKPPTERRNPGRNDGYKWNADHFLCGPAVEGDYDADEDYLYELEWLSGEAHVASGGAEKVLVPARYEVSLGEIAKPHKKKGASRTVREFEMVETVQRVIVLEDSEDEEPETESDDEWENIEREEGARPSYSAVVAATPG